MNRFEKLAAIDCAAHIEKKNDLSYLSWAWAWDQFKRVFPDSYFTVYESPDGRIYWTDGMTCWVKTGVTLVDGDFSLEHIEYLPVMDMRNRSIQADAVTSTDANKAIQRSLTKAVARHGLGLYIYAGEDLPLDADDVKGTPVEKQAKPAKVTVAPVSAVACSVCHKPISGAVKKSGEVITAEEVVKTTTEAAGKPLCCECFKSWKKVYGV